MLARPGVARRRPGLLGTMARTAVVAGTASATVGAVRGRQARRQQQAAQEQAAQRAVAEQQQELDQMRDRVDQMQAGPPATAGTTAPASAGAGGTQPAVAHSGDLATRLQQLADLHAAGALSDAEFAAAKAKLLGA